MHGAAAAAFTFPYKTRIAQFPTEARIISVSNKIQRQTLAGNARFLLTPKAPFFPLLPRALSLPLQIQFSVATLHHNSLLPSALFLSRASRSALFSGRNIARNNVKYLLSGRLFPSARRDKHHYVMYIKSGARASSKIGAREYAGRTKGGGKREKWRINFRAPFARRIDLVQKTFAGPIHLACPFACRCPHPSSARSSI